MVPNLLMSALLVLGASAVPAPGPDATTTPYEAPRPSSVPGFGFSETYGPTIAGAGAFATGGPAGGEAAGTLLYGSEYQAAGHLTGKFGDASGQLIGTINDGGYAIGCAGGGVDSEGFTQCLQFPPRAAAATPSAAIGGCIGGKVGSNGFTTCLDLKVRAAEITAAP